MKFPKSMHPEGFYDHLDKTAPEHLPEALKPGVKPSVKAGARPLTGGSRPLLQEGTAPPPVAPQMHRPTTPPAASMAPRAQRSNTAPWVLGVGVGVLLVAVAVMMSRNLSSREPAPPPATVVGQASPSPEEAQLQSAPPAAGPATPAPDQAARAEPAAPPAPIVEPRSEPTHDVAAAPIMGKPATIVRAAPTPRVPEVVAQAAPREAALQPLPTTPAPAAVTPPVATPTAPAVPPPVAQAEPQPPAAAPEDAGITVQVRTALAADTALAAVPIAVSTDHGVVKLEGQAPDAQTRERATVVAAGTTGVKAVDNRLTLPPPTVVGQAPSNGL